MTKLQWLRPIPELTRKYHKERYRHTNADKGERVEPEQILHWIEKNHWEYSPTDQAFLIARDKALVSLAYVLCGRISEILALSIEQFYNVEGFLILRNYHVEKNKQNPIRDDWALPKTGRLAPFTEYIQDYLTAMLSREESKLFQFKRARAYQIVKHITGHWPHWFRCMGEAYYMKNVFKEPVKCATALRLRRSDTLIEYVPFNWKDYAKELSA